MAQPSTEGPFPERRPESPVLQRRGVPQCAGPEDPFQSQDVTRLFPA